MGLIANCIANGFSGRFMGAAQGALVARAAMSPVHHAAAFGQITSFPQGRNSFKAIVPTVRTGGNISARARGEFDMVGALTAIGNMEGLLDGEFDMVAAGNVAFNGYALFDGEFDMVAGASGIGSMSANMDILARPSANDIAQEVWSVQAAAFAATGTTGKKLNDAESAAKLSVALSA